MTKLENPSPAGTSTDPRHVILGRDGQNQPFTLDLPELLATRLLVQGNSGSGKSHLLRRLLEQTAAMVQQVVIDPEGDFTSLAKRYGHVTIDAHAYSEKDLQAAARRARAHRVSVVLNLEHCEVESQIRLAGTFLNGLFDMPRACWFPALVVVDEAQLFAPTAGGDTSEEARRLSLGAMTNLMCRGRKRGLAGVIATQRLAKLAKNVAAEASNFLMGRTFLDIDMVRAADLLGMDRRTAEAFRDLARGQFMGLGPALSRRPVMVTIGSVVTASQSTAPTLLPLRERSLSAEELHALVLAAPSGAPAPAQDQQGQGSLLVPPSDTATWEGERFEKATPPDLNAQLDAYIQQRAPGPTEQEHPAELPPQELWQEVENLLDDPQTRFWDTPANLHQAFTMALRLQGHHHAIPALDDFKLLLDQVRSGISHEGHKQPPWQAITAKAMKIAPECQGLFLFLAHAAMTGAPCPPDDKLAEIYGTLSQRRARQQLDHLDQAGLIVVDESAGKRTVALVGTDWRTS
ncbi:ATP-binding protein [Formicincola oecophyllae]|uniref:ATP-binding protein n=1 Tax=Formicincola oecophyllae TaxID=2558361 RepID=A0A4Y6U8U7_9PROT|nr:ATP-binding protein [Formicincola oecophyllae]QDH13792.1 ATP-binding protein [Formicincola oecophyllae]